jgi:hypothetical protein
MNERSSRTRRDSGGGAVGVVARGVLTDAKPDDPTFETAAERIREMTWDEDPNVSRHGADRLGEVVHVEPEEAGWFEVEPASVDEDDDEDAFEKSRRAAKTSGADSLFD